PRRDGSRVTSLALVVNGDRVEVDAPGSRRLLDVLRENLGLTGTKEGCGEGECGACSVLVDGLVVDSCLVPVCQVVGAVIEAVAGTLCRCTGYTKIVEAVAWAASRSGAVWWRWRSSHRSSRPPRWRRRWRCWPTGAAVPTRPSGRSRGQPTSSSRWRATSVRY